MIKKCIFGTVLILVGMAALLGAQDATQAPAAEGAAPPAPPASPVAEQPKITSQEEMNAIQAIMQAPDENSRIEAANALVEGFAKSEWKGFALQMATLSYQSMNDYDNMMIYGERTLEADPDSYMVMLAMAPALAQKTREFDLDKEEKLGRAVELANKAIEVLETAPRPNDAITDEQWDAAKSDFRAQAYEALGMVALVRKDYQDAATQFKASIDNAQTTNPATQVRLAVACGQLKNYGEAITILDSVLANPNLHQSIRSIAQAERVRSVQAQKAAGQ